MSNTIGFGPMTDLDTPDTRKSVGNADPRLTRTNYFDGRLLTARDLIRDQHYLDDRTREVGRAIGSGIAHGLQVGLSDRGLLTVQPGLAVAPSGRVLELADRALHVNLYDQALLSELNDGASQVLDNGLYAVTLQFTEIGTDSAEAYPQDLASERGFHYNTYTEGVELVLVRLRTPLPQANKLQGQQRLSGHRGLGARAALVPELIHRDGQPPELPGDAVALALLAIRDQRPQWLDLGLVRRPLRPSYSPLALQQDLHAHYMELIAEVTSVRIQLGLQQDYPADLYFRQLPPHGALPKDGMDPAAGAQRFFPEPINVSIAPVREGDLPALIAESAALDPIDLEADEPAEVMVVVPLGDSDFAWRARQLQHDMVDLEASGHSRLAHIDPLALRLYDMPPSHEVDTDATVWADIWSSAEQVYYLRRPPRVTETQVSAVVLASGYKAPEPGSRPPPASAELERQLAAAREELTDCQAKLEQALKDLEDAGGADTEALAACRRELRDAEQALAAARERAAGAEADLHDATTEAAELEKALKRAEETITELKAELEASGGAGDAEAELRAKLAACEAEIKTLREQLEKAKARAALADSLQEEVDALQKELAAAQARIAELEAAGGDAGRITELETRIKEVSAERDRALAKLAECQAGRADKLDLAAILKRRGVADRQALAAGEQLDKLAGRDVEAAAAIGDAVLLVERRYDSVLYPSLVSAAKAGKLAPFVDFIAKQDPRSSLGAAVAASGASFGITRDQLKAWKTLGA